MPECIQLNRSKGNKQNFLHKGPTKAGQAIQIKLIISELPSFSKWVWNENSHYRSDVSVSGSS